MMLQRMAFDLDMDKSEEFMRELRKHAMTPERWQQLRDDIQRAESGISDDFIDELYRNQHK